MGYATAGARNVKACTPTSVMSASTINMNDDLSDSVKDLRDGALDTSGRVPMERTDRAALNPATAPVLGCALHISVLALPHKDFERLCTAAIVTNMWHWECRQPSHACLPR